MRRKIFPGIFFVAILLACADLLAQSATSGATPPAQPRVVSGFCIAGRVVNAVTGEPVSRAMVAVLNEANRETVGSAETDNEGRFALEGLAAGKYPLSASKRGFLTSFYEQHDEGYSSAIVTGEGQETGDLVFKLSPGAALHGVVTGDGGDPVEGAQVMLFLKPHGHNPGVRIAQAGNVVTDDLGEYEFDDLTPGEYMLAVKTEPWYALHRAAGGSPKRPESDFSSTLDVAYPVTFFDSTTEEGAATRIALAAGSREEANVNLHAVPALHLFVSAPAKQDGSIVRPLLRQSVFGTPILSAGAGFSFGKQTGDVEFTGVAPGHYELTQGDPPRIVELDATASQQIGPGIGTPTASVSGNLLAAGGFVLPENLSIFLSSREDANGQASLQTGCMKGSFSFDAVPPGRWRLIALSPEKTLSIPSVSVNHKAQAGSLFTVQDKPVQVEATVSLGVTQVKGFAGKNDKGKAGAMIVLVPRNSAANEDQFRRDQSDSDGSFTLHDVVPGEYTVVAIEDGWELDWARSEVIGLYLPKGIPVTVTENSAKQMQLSKSVPVQSR